MFRETRRDISSFRNNRNICNQLEHTWSVLVVDWNVIYNSLLECDVDAIDENCTSKVIR